MSATIEIGLDQATIDNYIWTSDNKALADLLNAMRPVNGASGADPDPELTQAQQAATRLGGKVLKHDEIEFDPDVVY